MLEEGQRARSFRVTPSSQPPSGTALKAHVHGSQLRHVPDASWDAPRKRMVFDKAAGCQKGTRDDGERDGWSAATKGGDKAARVSAL